MKAFLITTAITLAAAYLASVITIEFTSDSVHIKWISAGELISKIRNQ